MREAEFWGRERPVKKLTGIEFISKDGLIFWQEKYDDGSLGKPESTNLTADAGAESLRVWREHKLRELGLTEDKDLQQAA